MQLRRETEQRSLNQEALSNQIEVVRGLTQELRNAYKGQKMDKKANEFISILEKNLNISEIAAKDPMAAAKDAKENPEMTIIRLGRKMS